MTHPLTDKSLFVAENILRIVRALRLWNGRRIEYPGLPGHINITTNQELIIPGFEINPETDGFKEKDVFNKRPCWAYALVRVYLENVPESWIETDKKGGPAIEIYFSLTHGCYMHGNIYLDLESHSQFKDSWTKLERAAEIGDLCIFTTGVNRTSPCSVYEADSLLRVLLSNDPRNIDLERLV